MNETRNAIAEAAWHNYNLSEHRKAPHLRGPWVVEEAPDAVKVVYPATPPVVIAEWKAPAKSQGYYAAKAIAEVMASVPKLAAIVALGASLCAANAAIVEGVFYDTMPGDGGGSPPENIFDPPNSFMDFGFTVPVEDAEHNIAEILMEISSANAGAGLNLTIHADDAGAPGSAIGPARSWVTVANSAQTALRYETPIALAPGSTYWLRMWQSGDTLSDPVIGSLNTALWTPKIVLRNPVIAETFNNRAFALTFSDTLTGVAETEQFTAVPEPGTCAVLVGIGLAGFAVWRRVGR